MAATPPPPPHSSFTSSKSCDLEITVVSAKHLKNVNWRSGDLKPYAVAYLHPDRRSATKPDESGSTRPVWNERLTLPLPATFDPRLLLTLDVFHSKPSETPKPLVGSARIPLKDLIDDPDHTDSNLIKTIELNRPSGRPQGKIRIKISIRERPAPPDPSFQFPPPSNYPYHYSQPPPPPLPQPQPQHIMPPYSHPIIPPPPYSGYSSPYSGNYYPYYSAAATPPPAVREYYGGPSAPIDYTTPGNSNSNYDQRIKSARVAAGIGGITLEEKKEEKDFSVRDNYSEYRADY